MSRNEWIVLGAIGVVVAVVTLVWAVRLALRLVAVRRALVALGGKGTAVFWAAMIYTISPIDILPDPIYLDDVSVLGIALWVLTRMLRRQTGAAKGTPAASRPGRLATGHGRSR